MPRRPDARVRALVATTVAFVVSMAAACGSGPSPRSAPATAVAGQASAAPTGLDQVVDAGQAVVVTASGYGATTATLTTYGRAGAGWQVVSGPWSADVGAGGLAPPGEKTEGDGRTPSGTFGFDFFFGVRPDPGVRFPYRQVTGPSIVWDDDPSSVRYNQWVDQAGDRAGHDPEPMFQSPAYDFGAVIAYNSARTPGLGSAIFLHVSTGGPTAGCVSLPENRLLEVLRWLDPGQRPVVVMAVAGT